MEQASLVAGDTLNFQRSVPGYTPADGWALKYRLVPRSTAGGAAVVDITAAPEGDEYRVQVGPATTAAWAPGMYTWASWVERTGERYSIAQGQIEIKPDPAALTAGSDTRSPARRALDDARAALYAWNPTVRRYRIGEREREFNSTAEIVRLITELEREVLREEQVRPGRRILTRL